MIRIIVVLVLGLLGSVAYAEVVELEGKVKAVNADARTISIARKTPKGEKVLELEVAKKVGDISGFKEGDSVSFSYDPDLELITKIGKGMSAAVVDGDLKFLQGKWVAATLIISGNKLTKGEMQRHNRTFLIEGTKYTETILRDGKVLVVSGTLSIDPKTKGFEISGDITSEGKPFGKTDLFGFYEIKEDKVSLTLRRRMEGASRPSKFGEGDEGKAWTNSFILERDE